MHVFYRTYQHRRHPYRVLVALGCIRKWSADRTRQFRNLLERLTPDTQGHMSFVSELVIIKRLLSDIELFTRLSENQQKKVAALFKEIIKELSSVVPHTTDDGGSDDKA